jgi:hypothetical protein
MGDFNGDGVADIAIAESFSNAITLLALKPFGSYSLCYPNAVSFDICARLSSMILERRKISFGTDSELEFAFPIGVSNDSSAEFPSFGYSVVALDLLEAGNVSLIITERSDSPKIAFLDTDIGIFFS